MIARSPWLSIAREPMHPSREGQSPSRPSHLHRGPCYLSRNFSCLSPAFNLAASQRGLRPRPVQVSEGLSGLAYLAATFRPLPPRPAKRSPILNPALAAIDSSFCRSSDRLRSWTLAFAFLTFSSYSWSSLKDILSGSFAMCGSSLFVRSISHLIR